MSLNNNESASVVLFLGIDLSEFLKQLLSLSKTIGKLSLPLIFAVALFNLNDIALAQDGSAPAVDTFSSESADSDVMPDPGSFQQLVPSLIPSLINNPSEKQTKLAKDIEQFEKSLPNNRHALIAKLKGLIQQCLNEWDVKWDEWTTDHWAGYCDAILRKLRREDKCTYAWYSVYYFAETWKGGDSLKKEAVLKEWAKAEKVCAEEDDAGLSAAPKYDQNNVTDKMPPLAPPRSTGGMPPTAPPTNQVQRAEDIFNPVPENVSPEFRQKIEKAWQEIPNAHRKLLKNGGVTINMVAKASNEAGSDGLYDPASNQITVGIQGYKETPNYRMFYNNPDPGGTLKHELGMLYIGNYG